MASPDEREFTESPRESGQPGESIGTVTIEDNGGSSGSLRERLFASLRDGGEDSGAVGGSTDSNSEPPKRRGRKPGSKNKATAFEVSSGSLIGAGLRGNVSGFLRMFGHSMAKMYAPYGDYWEYDKTELEIISQLSENVVKQVGVNVENLSLKTSVAALVGVVGIGFGVRGVQTYMLMKQLKSVQLQQQQMPSYQRNDNPNVAQSYSNGQSPSNIHDYADLMSDTLPLSGTDGLP